MILPRHARGKYKDLSRQAQDKRKNKKVETQFIPKMPVQLLVFPLLQVGAAGQLPPALLAILPAPCPFAAWLLSAGNSFFL